MFILLLLLSVRVYECLQINCFDDLNSYCVTSLHPTLLVGMATVLVYLTTNELLFKFLLSHFTEEKDITHTHTHTHTHIRTYINIDKS